MQNTVNEARNEGGSVTVGLPNLETTRRDLIALRVKHGADSDIGHGCSNIIELIQQPELPSKLIQYQTDRLARLLANQT